MSQEIETPTVSQDAWFIRTGQLLNRVSDVIILTIQKNAVRLALMMFAILSSAYALFLVVEYAKSIIHLYEGSEAGEAATALVEAGDGILLLTAMFLIGAGSYVLNVDDHLDRVLPTALRNLSSGTLKGKLLSSLIVVIAVYLFKLVVELVAASAKSEETDLILMKMGAFASILVVYALVSFVIDYNNRHHDAIHAGGHEASKPELDKGDDKPDPKPDDKPGMIESTHTH